MKPFQIKYRIISEIGHGSPYNLSELEVVGESKFAIEKSNGWQDKHTWSNNGKLLAQVKWDLINNDPGFRIVLFDSENGELMQTDHIEGCCKKLRLNKDSDIDYETFTKIPMMGMLGDDGKMVSPSVGYWRVKQ